MSIHPPRAPTPPSSSSSFPQPPSFFSSPSKNRRAPPSFPPNSNGQPYASSSTFRFKEYHPSQLSPTTPAAVRVSPPTPRRRGSSDRGSSPLDESRRPPTPREVYSGVMPTNRPRSNAVERGGAGGGLAAEPPREYYIARQRQLAPRFWNNEKNSDCTILVQLTSPSSAAPSPGSDQGNAFPPRRDSGTPPRAPSTAPLVDGFAASGRRGSAAMPGVVSVLTFHLHREYLTTQSTLFRKLLVPNSLNSTSGALPPTPNTSRSTNPSLRARLVPPLAASNKPTILLPLPDPTSFGLITHFLYWGNASVIERALCERKVGWEGLFKNIEFLGLDNAFKLVCAKWWRKWIRPSSSSRELASAPASSISFSLTTPPSSGSQADSAHEQITPTSSTFPGSMMSMHTKRLALHSGNESDDDEEGMRVGTRGGYEEELERRMMELGRRGST